MENHQYLKNGEGYLYDGREHSSLAVSLTHSETSSYVPLNTTRSIFYSIDNDTSGHNIHGEVGLATKNGHQFFRFGAERLKPHRVILLAQWLVGSLNVYVSHTIHDVNIHCRQSNLVLHRMQPKIMGHSVKIFFF